MALRFGKLREGLSILLLLVAALRGTAVAAPEDRRLPFDGEVYAVLLEADGGMIVGGEFQSYRKKPVPSLVRLKPDGTLDPAFATLSTGWKGVVRDLARWRDGKLLVVGDALTIGSAAPTGIVRLNRDGSVDAGFRSSVGPEQRFTRVVSLSGGAVLALSAGILWRLEDDGNARIIAGTRLTTITDVQAAPGDKLIVASEDVGGWYLQRWTPDGDLDPTFSCALNRAGKTGGPGEFARVNPSSGRAMVTDVLGPAVILPRSASASAYLEPGDILVAIQELGQAERPLAGVGINEARSLLQGPAGSVATFTVERGRKSAPPATFRLSVRRRPDQTEARRDRPRGRPRGDARTPFHVQPDGKVIVAREAGLEAEVIRLLEDGRVDAAFSRVPRRLVTEELESRHRDTALVEDHAESTHPQSATMLFTTAWRYDPPAVVVLSGAANGKTYAALSDGHVVRLEPDGALDLSFHVRFSGLVRSILPLPAAGAAIVRDHVAPDDPPFAGRWGDKGGVVLFDGAGKPARR